jgi:hypothetical protein
VSTPDAPDPYRPPPDSGPDPYRPPSHSPPDGAGADRPVPDAAPRPWPGSPAPQPERSGPLHKAPPDHPAARAGRTALLVAIAGVGMTVVVYPVGLVLDLAAVILGVRARRRARTAGFRAPAATTAISLGACSLVFVIGMVALLGPQLARYQECMSGANTEIARQNCETAFIRDVEQRFGVDLPQGAG